MYLLTQPFIDYTNAQVQSVARLTQSHDIAEITRSSIESFWRLVQENQSRFLQSDALAQLTKANVENLTRFVQDYSRSLSALAVQTQGELTKRMQEGTRQLQQVANTTSNIAGSVAHETAETMKKSADKVATETDVALARAATRR